VTRDALHWHSATALAALIRARAVSSVEVTRYMLERAARLQPALNSYALIDAEGALSQAEAADAWLAHGKVCGPLHGVPVAVKDIFATRGLPTSAGVPRLAHWRPNHDATVVQRLRDSGAVLLGKLQMTEGGWAAHHPQVAAPVNPWHADYAPGGSSSGAGVALAAGLCFAALGTDTGGSVRQPAAATGVYGLKPTFGKVSRHGVLPMSPGMDHVGLMARSVRDVAALLGIVAGSDGWDPATVDVPVRDFLGSLGMDGPLRIGIPDDWPHDGVDASVLRAVEHASALLRDAGMQLSRLPVPNLHAAAAAWLPLCAPDVAAMHAYAYATDCERYGPALLGLIEAGRHMPAQRRIEAEHTRARFALQMQAVFERVDVLLLPMTPGGPARHSAMRQRGASTEAVEPALAYTAPFNMSGHPALAMPCLFTPEGLPVGVQLVGRHGAEQMLLDLALRYEQRLGSQPHPPGC
jgi:amidase